MPNRADVDALRVPDSGEPNEMAGKGYAHTLSLRLTAQQYRRLRRFVADQEEKTGKRATHQALIEQALDDYLTKAGG